MSLLFALLVAASPDASVETDPVAAFERAVEAAPDDLHLALHLSHAYLVAERPADALEEALRAQPLAKEVLAQPLLEARARRALDDAAGAYRVLNAARASYPEEPRVVLELVDLTVHLNMTNEALRLANALLALRPDRDQTLALFHLFQGRRAALSLLERAATVWPKDAEIWAHLAVAYGATEAHHVSAHLFENATRLGGAYAFDAAEQYRVSGEYEAALAWNSRVAEPERRREQRIAILFDRKSYARIVALAEVADSSDPVTMYRFAYANFALGQHDRASELARRLRGTRYEGAARSLLEAMGR